MNCDITLLLVALLSLVNESGSASTTIEPFVYDGDNIALTFDGIGNQTHRYLHGAEVDQILADENAAGELGGKPRHVHSGESL